MTYTSVTLLLRDWELVKLLHPWPSIAQSSSIDTTSLTNPLDPILDPSSIKHIITTSRIIVMDPSPIFILRVRDSSNMNDTVQWSGFFKELVGSCMRGEVDYTVFLGLALGKRGSDSWGEGDDVDCSNCVTSLEEVLKCIRSDFTGCAS
jgi:hypothetical protein